MQTQPVRAVARAGVDDSTKSLYEPGAPRILLPFLDVSAADVPTHTFYTLIELTLGKQQGRQPLEIIELEKPQGGRVLVVKGAEDQQPVC